MLRSMGPIAATVIVLSVFAGSAVAQSKPNVLFLFSDDHRADAIGAFSKDLVKTPNLDALIARGRTFTNAYCLGSNSGAVCSPSRNMLLSGRSYFRFTKPPQGNVPLAMPDQPHLAGEFKKLGYVTYHHGKRGNTALRLQAEFDTNRYLTNDEAERRSSEPGKEIADQAIRFLTTDRPKDKPFLMYLAFGNPHDPRVAAEKYMQQYRREEIPLPKNYAPFHPFDNGELFVRDEQLAPWPRTEAEVRKQLHEYYATITGMDHHLGRVLQALRDAGLAENTLIVYSSDHGLAMGSHGLFGKQSLYEHSMKSPLVFAGPGVAKGSSEAFVYLLDLFPTLVDLCGGTVPDGLDGQSFAGAVRGKSATGRETICLSYRDSQRTIRLAHWKVHRYPQINKTMLFHLDRDPEETTDLSGDPTHRGRIEGMLGLLAKEQPRWGDRLPLNVPNPKPGTVTEETFRNRGKK